MTRLGAGHTRWHVRAILVEILQAIRDQEKAVVALEGLQDAEPIEVQWSILDFGARSLHPVLRAGIAAIHRAADQAS